MLFVMMWGKEMAVCYIFVLEERVYIVGNMANLRYNLLYYLRGISARVAGGISVHVLFEPL